MTHFTILSDTIRTFFQFFSIIGSVWCLFALLSHWIYVLICNCTKKFVVDGAYIWIIISKDASVITNILWASLFAELDSSINAVMHSSSFVVLETELNMPTLADKLDLKFSIFSEVLRLVFHSWLNALYNSLKTSIALRWYHVKIWYFICNQINSTTAF